MFEKSGDWYFAVRQARNGLPGFIAWCAKTRELGDGPEIYGEGRDIELIVHQSGTMEIWGGAFFHYQINPDDEIKADHSHDWTDDPVVKQFACKSVLTLCWDEALEMFGERKTKSTDQ